LAGVAEPHFPLYLWNFLNTKQKEIKKMSLKILILIKSILEVADIFKNLSIHTYQEDGCRYLRIDTNKLKIVILMQNFAQEEILMTLDLCGQIIKYFQERKYFLFNDLDGLIICDPDCFSVKDEFEMKYDGETLEGPEVLHFKMETITENDKRLCRGITYGVNDGLSDSFKLMNGKGDVLYTYPKE
jgi:hypothetical protein